jgi:hypothetical protein
VSDQAMGMFENGVALISAELALAVAVLCF